MNRKTGLYRSRNGVLCGVCAGIAEYFDASVFWIRFAVIMLLLFTGLWPVVIAYFLTALILKPAPVCPLEDEDERDFYDAYMRSPENAADRLRTRFEHLDRRIRRMEDAVTNRTYDWDGRFHRK